MQRRPHNAWFHKLFSEESTRQDHDITDVDLYGDLELDITQQLSHEEVHLVLTYNKLAHLGPQLLIFFPFDEECMIMNLSYKILKVSR
jgi:hypothetical protein